MGMSADLEAAVAAGATWVRIGTALFGETPAEASNQAVNRVNMKQRIAFIGGGNMGRSLIGGLIAKGIEPAQIVVADPYAPTLESLKTQYNVQTASSNADAVRDADVVLLAVKPQELRNVVTGVAGTDRAATVRC